jgi:integrase
MSEREPYPGHPGFYVEGNRIYTRAPRDRRGNRQWLTGATLKEAQRKRAVAEEEAERGEFRARSRETFASYAASWIDTYQGRTASGVKKSTRDDYRRRLEQKAIPFFGRLRMSEIEPRDVKEYALELAKQPGRNGGCASRDTVRLAVAPVRALFATAVEEGLIRSNPAAGIRLPQRTATPEGEDEGEIKAMTEEQLRTLLAVIAADNPEWYLFFRFLVWSGLRIGEAVELRWKDVDLGGRIVHVRRGFYDGTVGPPKTRFGKRKLRLTQELARALWTLRAGAGDEELVFTTTGRRDPGGAGGGKRINQRNLMQRVLKPAAIAAGLGEWVKRENGTLRADSWVTFHTFRHTCATTLFRRGWNAPQVQKWLGHHKASFTLDRYVHLLDEDVPTPEFFDEIAALPTPDPTDPILTREGLNEPKPAPTVTVLKPAVSRENPDSPSQAETAGANF